jgi:DNA primase RepB-like protein
MNILKAPVTSREYLNSWYQTADRIAIFVRNYATGESLQRIVTAEKAASDKFMAWLQFLNRSGGNIYSSVNGLQPNASGRTKADIHRVLGLHMEIDHNGTAAVETLLQDCRIPRPTFLINSSVGRYQLLWRVDHLTAAKAEVINKALARDFGGDPAATDITRVLRLPGFHNQKYEPSFPITAQYLSQERYSPSDFHLDLETTPVTLTLGVRRSIHAGPHKEITQSERDWANVMDRLRRGESREAIQRDLELHRQDKPQPAYYAQHTLDKATRELEMRRHFRSQDSELEL